jgi:hypothetical protein
MNIWITSDINYQFSTIGISASKENWGLISKSIFQGELVIKADYLPEDRNTHDDPNIVEDDLEYLRILVDEFNYSSEFTISFDKSILTIKGSRVSLNNLRDLAEEFSNINATSGDHVHLGYINFKGYEYNWFSNKNIDLILSIKD